MQRSSSALVLLCLIANGVPAACQQVASPDFAPTVRDPAFSPGSGPLVVVDEAHHNFHTLSPTQIPDATHQGWITVPGRLGAFHDLLEADGYRVEPLTEPFSSTSLAEASVLMISNALARQNVEDWSLPNPSAFTDQEIEVLLDWVEAGGALLLVADHQPFAGAAQDLAAEFGFIFNNGYAGAGGRPLHPDVFSVSAGTLSDHVIRRGRSPSEQVEAVMTFTGQAFRALPGIGAASLMTFPTQSLMVLVQDPFAPDPPPDETITIRIDGMLHAAVRTFGQGRIAVFGEAAMFTAQVTGPDEAPMGMNHPGARDNAQFVLNTFHWLSGLLPADPR